MSVPLSRTDFPAEYQSRSCDPGSLFAAPVVKIVSEPLEKGGKVALIVLALP